ncbi:type 2 lanthipeptide synthetase LanM family protein [Streptomyces cinereoruber]|uniref:type 2 lanthipeptide synthetase LanM family protein n=1 Tax=Streptomyces cinereoruber TaxID=67260 RepID=UPI0036274955
MSNHENFDPILAWLADRETVDLRQQLVAQVSNMDSVERELLLNKAHSMFTGILRLKLTRLLILEFYRLRASNVLTKSTPEQRWAQFLQIGRTSEFWHEVSTAYPALQPRLRNLLYNRKQAVVEFAQRLVTDRAGLQASIGSGPITDFQLELGDTHRGGRSVVRIDFEDRSILYKPRPVEVDVALRALVSDLTIPGEDGPWFDVAQVYPRGGYGWADFVTARHCSNDAEQRRFYRGLGACLAVLVLVGGTDMHMENIIACGPTPVIIDCETLFSPDIPLSVEMPPSRASQLATSLLRRSALRTGLLPTRYVNLPGEPAIDISGAAALPQEQAAASVPVLVGGGTDTPRIEVELFDAEPSLNLPVLAPDPRKFWDEVVVGYQEYSRRITELAQTGRLKVAMTRFSGCEVRSVPRSTSLYVEIGRSLWHPDALRHESRLVDEVARILAAQAPDSATKNPETIRAEIDALRIGDIPIFTFTPDVGLIQDPDGVVRNHRGGPFDKSGERWARHKKKLDEEIIRATLSFAYADQAESYGPQPIPLRDSEYSELTQVIQHVSEMLSSAAITGDDATATWIGPALLADGGVGLEALGPDLYQGQAGVAVALAAYLYSARRQGDDLDRGMIEDLTAGAIRTLHVSQASGAMHETVGGFDGLGGGIWSWLALDHFEADPNALPAARQLAERAPELIEHDEKFDIVSGAAGVIVPLLGLSERTGDTGYLDLADIAARHLAAHSQVSEIGACWPTRSSIPSLAGFAHGSSGIAWSLARLGQATSNQQWIDLAEAGFAFADNWLRSPQNSTTQTQHSWCHGRTGVGIAAADMFARTAHPLRHATAQYVAELSEGSDCFSSDTLCHGRLGLWELQRLTGRKMLESSRDLAYCMIKRGLHVDAPPGGLAPGLMNGLSGVLYQLLRMERPDVFPSVLLLES